MTCNLLDCIISFLEWLYPKNLSAVAAVCSACTAIFMYRFTVKQNQREWKSDLYNVIMHLAGFANYVQVLCQYHDSTPLDMEMVVQKLCDENKNILSMEQKFYFNDKFDEQVISDIGQFMEQYLAWQAFHIGKIEEVFLEIDIMLEVQEKAIHALGTIKNYYRRNKKISNVINRTCCHFDDISDSCNSLRNNLRYISRNLSYVFSLDRMQDELVENCNLNLEWNEICRIIVIGCLSDLFSNEIGKGTYAEASDFLFNKELVPRYTMRFFASDETPIEWRTIYLYLWHFIGDPTERLNEISNLQRD